MKEGFSQIRVFRLDQFNYPKFRKKIIDLYLNAFTTGEYAQYIPLESAESTLDEMLRNGWGNMAFVGDKLAGVLIALPLSHDNDFPHNKCFRIPVESSLYIAEVMTHSDFRGKGVASKLIENFLEEAKDNYTDVVIRVWDKNEPALSLYEKMGFERMDVDIVQTKFRDKNEAFEMRKIYLFKRIR
ncbi:MAG: GNAT family N-acetyltransferase [Bacteroidia bacterium]|nr:GNAT family N-acetyltransferase [Bacteroidia bacterium]